MDAQSVRDQRRWLQRSEGGCRQRAVWTASAGEQWRYDLNNDSTAWGMVASVCYRHTFTGGGCVCVKVRMVRSKGRDDRPWVERSLVLWRAETRNYPSGTHMSQPVLPRACFCCQTHDLTFGLKLQKTNNPNTSSSNKAQAEAGVNGRLPPLHRSERRGRRAARLA